MSHANIAILTIVISSFFSCRPMEGWVSGCLSHALKLLSVQFWVFWIQLNAWRYVSIRLSLPRFYEMSVSVYWKMSRSQYHIGNSVMGVLREGCICIPLLLQSFRYGINCETSFSIQIHPPRKTDAEIDEYTHFFTYLTVSRILKTVLIRTVRRVIHNLKLSLR
jgi:hypothetical protein